jgi:hypothetical protein
MTNNRVIITVLVLVILVLIPHTCDEKDLKLEPLKQEINLIEEIRIKERDSLNTMILEREVQNNILASENNALKSNIKTIKSKHIEKVEGLENLVAYFNQRFEVDDNKVVDNRVGLTEETASDITWELEDYDNISEISSLQQGVINNQDTIISNLNKDKQNLSLVISSAENELEQRKRLQELADEQIKGLNRKNKRRSFFDKVLIIGSGVGGFLIGKKL